MNTYSLRRCCLTLWLLLGASPLAAGRLEERVDHYLNESRRDFELRRYEQVIDTLELAKQLLVHAEPDLHTLVQVHYLAVESALRGGMHKRAVRLAREQLRFLKQHPKQDNRRARIQLAESYVATSRDYKAAKVVQELSLTGPLGPELDARLLELRDSLDLDPKKPQRAQPVTTAPDGMVRIKLGGGVFFLDTTEVTNRQYREFVRSQNYEAKGDWQSYYRTGGDTLPVRGLSFGDALAYAAWKKKRLPTEAEWLHAAAELSDPAAELSTLGGCRGRPRQAGPCRIASHPPNSLGVYDLEGNVSEWVSRGSASDVSQLRGILKGRAWLDPPDLTETRVMVSDELQRAGLRCVQDLSP